MTPELLYLILSALLCWVMLLVASLLRTDGWKPAGLPVAFGNRDDVPAPSPLSGRADRAAKNMLENLVLFAVLVFAARAMNLQDATVALGAQIFFWSRVVYFFVYLAGIKVVRTLVWAVSMVGLAMILRALFA